MSVGIVVSDSTHQAEHAEALAAGLGRHGIASTVYAERYTPSESIVACWGWRIGSKLRAEGREVMVLERGYIGDRFKETSIGWNGLNGRAWFPSFLDRVRLDDRLLLPWNPRGEYVLLVGQVDGDAAIANVDIRGWYRDVAAAISLRFRMPVRFRPHPMGDRFHVERAQTIDGTLADALAGAALVVTYNSNTGVDAVMAGKPTVAFDRGSMAWDVAAHSLYVSAEPLDRRAWAETLASRQWRLDEIRSGAALVPHLPLLNRSKAA